MLIKLPKYEYEEIVIGGSLNALLYSHYNDIPIVVNKLTPPHRFETFESSSALQAWNELFFTLSLKGLNLIGDKSRKIRIKENEISISTSGARVLKVKFNKLVIFDDENVGGLEPPTSENDNFIVLDWMVSRSCEKHEHELLTTDDNFVNKVRFYPTDRVDGHHPYNKDLVSVSYLSSEQMNNFEYSDTYAKFKVTSILKDLGIRGKKSGKNHYALKLEVERREIRKARMSQYKDLEHIKFKYETPQKKEGE